MGIFTKGQKVNAENIYEKSVKPYLKMKDGFIHVVMINSFGKMLNQSFECEDKYTVQIDIILTTMQKEGYEIVNVQFNSIHGQGAINSMTGFNTLITYK